MRPASGAGACCSLLQAACHNGHTRLGPAHEQMALRLSLPTFPSSQFLNPHPSQNRVAIRDGKLAVKV